MLRRGASRPRPPTGVTVALAPAVRSIGDGVIETCRRATESAEAQGTVVGLFRNGFYIQSGPGIFAIGGPELPSGPLHLVLSEVPEPPAENCAVRFAPELIRWPNGFTDWSAARRYRPAQPEPRALRSAAHILARLNQADTVPHDISAVWPEVEDAMRHADLDHARRRLAGRGEGLTPTGDDILAGLLLFAHWIGGDPDELRAIALRAETSLLSRSFLRWAAVGQSIEPICDVVSSALAVHAAESQGSAIQAQEAFDRSALRVARIGRSSGRGLLLGLGLAAHCSCQLQTRFCGTRLPEPDGEQAS